jgi:cell division protein FtsQ
MNGRRGSAGAGVLTGVLDAPEDECVREEELTETAAGGTLRRTRAGRYGETDDYASEVRRRGLSGRRGARAATRRLPRTAWGKVLVGSGVFAGLVAVTAAGLGVRNYLLHDARFVVHGASDVEIDGNKHLTREQLLSVFGADLDRNIFRIPLSERKADLERLPWVGNATVMRLLPDKIRVQIEERTPVAFAKQGTQIGLVDGNGVLLDMPAAADADAHTSFPVVTGIEASDPASTRKARMEIYHEFMGALDGGGKDGAAMDGGRPSDSVSEVDLTDPEDVKAVVASQGMDVLVHFGDQDFLTRYEEFESHLGDWKQMYPKLVSADMRYENQIVLDTGTAVSGAAAGAPAAGPAAVAGVAVAGPAAGSAAVVKAAVPVRAAAAAVKPAAAVLKAPVGAKPAAGTPFAATPPKVVARPVVKGKVSGKQKLIAQETNASNRRMYAALAAAHQAELAKAAARMPAAGGGTR